MQTSTIDSALSEVRQHCKESGRWFSPPPAHSPHCLVQNLFPCYAVTTGTPVIYAQNFHTPMGISAHLPAPHPVWTPHSQILTPMPQAQWLSPLRANTDPPAHHDYGDPSPYLLHTQNQHPPNQFQQPYNYNFIPEDSQLSASPTALGPQPIVNLLSFGCLRWDIRRHPTAARSSSSPSTIPNLDIPALPSGVEWAEIDFGNHRMKLFADTWGPVHVRARSDYHTTIHGVLHPILIRDILDEIYRYFMQRLNDPELTRLMSTSRQSEEISTAFHARCKSQGLDHDFYRRADLLPRITNFGQIELVGRGINSSFLRLRLYR